MKRAPRSRQRHDLYAKYHDYDSEISDLLGECGLKPRNPDSCKSENISADFRSDTKFYLQKSGIYDGKNFTIEFGNQTAKSLIIPVFEQIDQDLRFLSGVYVGDPSWALNETITKFSIKEKTEAANFARDVDRALASLLNQDCREILYISGILPRRSYLFSEEVYLWQIRLLIAAWTRISTDDKRVEFEEKLLSEYAIDDLNKIYRSIYLSEIPDEEPPHLDADIPTMHSLKRRFQLYSGNFEDGAHFSSSYNPVLDMGLPYTFANEDGSAASLETSEGALENDNTKAVTYRLFKPGKNDGYNKVILERFIDVFSREHSDDLIFGGVAAAKNLVSQIDAMNRNVSLSVSYGDTGAYPWEAPEYRRVSLPLCFNRETKPYCSNYKFYFETLLKSASNISGQDYTNFVLHPSSPLPKSESVSAKYNMERLVADLEQVMWSEYRDTVDLLISFIREEIARIEFEGEWEALEEKYRIIETASGNLPAFIFGTDAFKLLQCAPEPNDPHLEAGTLIANIEAAGSLLLSIEASQNDVESGVFAVGNVLKFSAIGRMGDTGDPKEIDLAAIPPDDIFFIKLTGEHINEGRHYFQGEVQANNTSAIRSNIKDYGSIGIILPADR